MKKQFLESIGENTNGCAIGSSTPSSTRQNSLKDVIEENIKLRQIVNALGKQLNDTQLENQHKHNDLLTTVAALSKQIDFKNGDPKPLGMPKASSTYDSDENSLHRAVSELTNDLTDLDLKFQLHENSTQDGHLIWKINDFEDRTENAVIGKIRALHSAPCFTEKYGYKFCLRLYINGDGMGRGIHLSLFLVIMKSEYDDILQWPFQKKIQFKLINQQDRSKDHVEQMFPEKNSSSFQQPKKEMNIASGCPMFISLDRLEPESFLKNGNLFLEVKIE